MKTAILLIGLIALELPISAEPSQAEKKPPVVKPEVNHYETVRAAPDFSIGPGGAAGVRSLAEISLRKLLKTPTAAADCRKLVIEGTPAGQLYGLLGLKLLNDPSYPSVVVPFRNSQVKVTVVDGCNAIDYTTSAVVRSLDKGRIK
jgi:hypothetical protein